MSAGRVPGPRAEEPSPTSAHLARTGEFAVRTRPPWGAGGPPQPDGRLWPSPAARSGTSVWGGLALVVVGLLALVAVDQIARIVGRDAALVAGAAALVPLAAVLLGIRWVDRWEPEPRPALLFALLWGAGVATLVSLALNTAAGVAVYATTGDAGAADTVAAVVVAPVVEESAKGVGVLLILWRRHRYFDGPVDGIVYAATVAAGFAFVENILYFGQSLDALPAVFAVRAVMSPFAHLLFTASIGIALGVASRSRSRRAWAAAFPVGWVIAVVLHALWNGSAVAGTFVQLYGVVQVPLFVGVVLLVLWLRRQERRVLVTRLGEYARAGWFAPHEVEMLTSLPARRQALAWAAQRGRRSGAAMQRFQSGATQLAYGRQRTASGRLGVGHGADERALLEKVTAARHEFLMAGGARR